MAEWFRFVTMLVVTCVATGCYYKDPYEAKDSIPHTSGSSLSRVYLAGEVGSDGLAHHPAQRFKAGQPIYLTVTTSGQGAAEVLAVLRHSEEGADLRVTRVVMALAPAAVTHEIGHDIGELSPGSYYLSIVFNGVPSWGLPFEIDPDDRQGARNVPDEK